MSKKIAAARKAELAAYGIKAKVTLPEMPF